MNLSKNLQFLRKMHQGMTQEELAEKLNVSRQTISKWEIDAAFPEMEKLLSICNLFSCTLDELVRENMDLDDDVYTNFRLETLLLKAIPHTIISESPEEDAKICIMDIAKNHGIESPEIIGWDFPFVSQEQVNVHHMHGYTAACILKEDYGDDDIKIIAQPLQQYAVITIKEPFTAPFSVIPNAYKTLMKYMEVNKLPHKETKEIIPCFEKVYEKNGVSYMDVYISVNY